MDNEILSVKMVDKISRYVMRLRLIQETLLGEFIQYEVVVTQGVYVNCRVIVTKSCTLNVDPVPAS